MELCPTSWARDLPETPHMIHHSYTLLLGYTKHMQIRRDTGHVDTVSAFDIGQNVEGIHRFCREQHPLRDVVKQQ
jgi:hypothetical protein